MAESAAVAIGGVAETGRPSADALLAGQVQYALRDFARTPVSAFFTLAFPLSFLVIISAIFGNEVVDPSTGLRLSQYVTPVFAVYAACMACYMSLSISLAFARQTGVLKRLRGTPLPTSAHLAGRIVGGIVIAAFAVALMITAGVLFYDVRIIAENVPVLILTFLVGTGCFTALGLAVAAAAPTANAAIAFSNATLMILSFISGIFAFGELPEWLDRVASFFPLEPFAQSFSDGFNPYVDASSPDWANLATMAAWGVVGGIVAWRSLGSEPAMRGGRRATDVGTPEADAMVGVASAGAPRVAEPGSPSPVSLVLGQVVASLRRSVRDPMTVFWSTAFPVLIVAFLSAVNGPETEVSGLPLPQYLAATFAVYGVAISAFMDLATGMGEQRASRLLKRLRGTPLPPWALLVGRVLAALASGLITVVLVFAVVIVFFDATLPPSTWPQTLLVLVLATACFAACGFALFTAIDGPQALVAASLGLLLPLSFVSDVFIVGADLPPVLNAIGWAFPLRHATAASITATSGGALDATFWGHLGVLALWTIGMALVSIRWFRWEPRARG